MNAKRPRALVLSVPLLISALSAQEFHPERQQPVKLVAPKVAVEAIQRPPDASTGATRELRLRTQAGESSVILPFQFAQVNSISLGPEGKLVVLGMVTGSVSEVGIVEIGKARIIDRFNCYRPAVSPGGGYVAFTKWFPPHFVESVEDHVMLYEVARSPAENRPAGIEPGNDIDVGFALYPAGAGNWKMDNQNVPQDLAHMSASDYFWRDSSHFLFADTVSEEFQVVWVTLANGLADVRSFTIPPAELGPKSNSTPWLADVKFGEEMAKLTI